MSKLLGNNVASRLIIFIATALSTCSVAALSKEYSLQPGDALELVVVGTPELRQRSVIGLEGEVVLPLVGHLKVAGTPVSEVLAKIKADLPNKVYQQRTNDGREISHIVSPEAVLLNVEYRPIYLNGDVAKPGEQSFRPGMTIRQAIALGGGYDLLRFRMTNPLLEGADLRAEHETLWAELVREQARIWRVRTELGEKVGASPTPNAPIGRETQDGLLAAELDQLRVRAGDLQKEKAYLQVQIKKYDANLQILAEKRKKDEEASQADMVDYERIRETFQRGLNTNKGISEARRATLYSSTQALSTITQISQSERQRAEFVRQLEKMDDQRRLDLMKELEDGLVRLASIRARLQSASEKLLYTSTLQSQLVRGKGGRPELAIFRVRGKAPERIAAHEDSELLPGDVVEVSLQIEPFPGVPVQ